MPWRSRDLRLGEQLGDRFRFRFGKCPLLPSREKTSWCFLSLAKPLLSSRPLLHSGPPLFFFASRTEYFVVLKTHAESRLLWDLSYTTSSAESSRLLSLVTARKTASFERKYGAGSAGVSAWKCWMYPCSKGVNEPSQSFQCREKAPTMAFLLLIESIMTLC